MECLEKNKGKERKRTSNIKRETHVWQVQERVCANVMYVYKIDETKCKVCDEVIYKV